MPLAASYGALRWRALTQHVSVEKRSAPKALVKAGDSECLRIGSELPSRRMDSTSQESVSTVGKWLRWTDRDKREVESEITIPQIMRAMVHAALRSEQ